MEDALKYLIPAMASVLLLNSSCSWYRNMERSLISDDEKQAKKSRTVSREQYDQLLVKYEELSKKYEQLKENPNANQPSLVDELQNTQGENFARPSANVDTETVSIQPGQPVVVAAEAPADLESQLSLYRRGLALKASNPAEATKIFQQLESQSEPVVKVRARLQVGELLFSKQQYDLALQVFEDIINKNSSSGVVLEALKYAAVCSEKLGIQNKKDQYTSMLNDVFETN
jgi:tetratricopeptide (TPR) repeat protein